MPTINAVLTFKIIIIGKNRNFFLSIDNIKLSYYKYYYDSIIKIFNKDYEMIWKF